MAESAEVVVVGGGIVGVSAAWYLAKRGIPVLLLEKGRIAGEQSSRNWGFVRQQGRDPAEVPLMIEANRIWQGLEKEVSADLEWTVGGNLVLGDTAQRMAELEAWTEVARDHQLHSRMLTKAEIEALIPGIHTSALGGLYTPSDGHAEPEKAAPAIAAAAEKLGATIRTGCAVRAVELANGAVSGVETERGFVRTRTVVAAAGAWSSRLLAGAGLRLPQLWMRGTVARTTAVEPITTTAVWAGLAFRQRRDGSFNIASGGGADHDLSIDSLIHGFRFLPSYRKHRSLTRTHLNDVFLDHLAGRLLPGARRRQFERHRVMDPKPSAQRVADSLATLKRTFPQVADALKVERAWAGQIDFMPDMIPVIDRPGRPEGLVIATGFSGHGFGMGPIAGRLAAELAAGERPSLDLTAFRFARFHDGTKLEPRNVI